MADIPALFAQLHGALNDFLLLFADALVLMLVWLGKRWSAQIGVRVHNERTRGILQRAESLAVAIVKRTFQEYVRPARATGTWTPDAEAEALRLATAELRSHLGFQGIQELAWVVFGEGAPPEDITDNGILRTLIEAAVHDTKQQGRALAPPPAAVPLFAPLAVERTNRAATVGGFAAPLASGAPSQTQPPPGSHPATAPQP